MRKYFNPRSPYGERQIIRLLVHQALQFQSTLPLRGATRWKNSTTCRLSISIHAPLTGSDYRYAAKIVALQQFQSTLPLRGATPAKPDAEGMVEYFNPRSPYGERRVSGATGGAWFVISIHAPLTGSDDSIRLKFVYKYQFQSTLPLRGATHDREKDDMTYEFQSTLPLRGATQNVGSQEYPIWISIHAPLTGSDVQLISCKAIQFGFQSTLPLRGATP